MAAIESVPISPVIQQRVANILKERGFTAYQERATSMAAIIGIDPGLGGGIAVIEGDSITRTSKMPETAKDLFDLLVAVGRATVFCEKVNAGPKMGSSAAFKFGQSVGELRMACIAAGLRIEYVTPQKWQKEFGLIVKGRGLGQGDTEKKNRNKARAQELYPNLHITHATADALLIATYGLRVLSRME